MRAKVLWVCFLRKITRNVGNFSDFKIEGFRSLGIAGRQDYISRKASVGLKFAARCEGGR